jgi:hypothetical protein
MFKWYETCLSTVRGGVQRLNGLNGMRHACQLCVEVFKG